MSAGSDRLARELGLSKLKGGPRALAEEAVRIKARLDTLDLWVNGKAEADWFEWGSRFGSEVTLLINAPLVEARQQAMALKAVLSELAKGEQAEKAEPAPSVADELKKRREARTSAIVQA